MKSWLQDNDITIYSGKYIFRNIEGKSVAAERFIRTLKNIINILCQYQKICILIN